MASRDELTRRMKHRAVMVASSIKVRLKGAAPCVLRASEQRLVTLSLSLASGRPGKYPTPHQGTELRKVRLHKYCTTTPKNDGARLGKVPLPTQPRVKGTDSDQ